MNFTNSGKYLSIGLAILLMANLLVLPAISAQTTPPDVRMYLYGPNVLGTLRTGTYSATFIDPNNRDWSYKVYITADNMTGASPLYASAINGTLTKDNNTIEFDVTGQMKTGQLEIHINCTSGSYVYEKVQAVTVVSPIILNANINNPSNIDIKNATVQFYVDGSEIDQQVIQSIGAKQNTSVESEWISDDKEPGWHDSRITVDINSDGIIDTHAGDIIIDDKFYIEDKSNWVFTLMMVSIGLIALILGIVYIFTRKMK